MTSRPADGVEPEQSHRAINTAPTQSFGPALRAARRDRGLSLGQLAQLVNYSKSHLSRVETDAKTPTEMLARRCDEVLRTDGRLSGLVDARRSGRRGPSLNQLPRAVPGLVGRAATMSALDRTLHLSGARRDSAECTVVVVDGQAGIGKTSTALNWAHGVARQFPDGLLFADLGGFGPGAPADTADVLRHFMTSLGGQVDAEVPAEHLAARYRSLMTGKRALIMLDNAADPGQVRPLLPAAGGCHVLVTSRNRLSGLVVRDGAERVTVPPMTEDEALRLLEAVAGPLFDRSAAPDIAQYCGYVPLALRVAAENIAGWHQSPCGGLCGGADEATALRTVLSWSYRKLAPAAANALQRLAVTAGETISPTTAADLLGTGVNEAHALLDALAEIHLLHQVAPGAYRLDQLTAAFSAGLNETPPLRPAPDD
ncbi:MULTISPECIES: helix-turn-helix domain-containing protein [unclassified Streptomyces]|jgi:DNA-binding transcriptional regulator YiaG|uniref:helix-turn-helix domain-containing protein n=1 Tax=unclassified Streptomyces TaxID=2593676 RepID=UPI00081B5D9A|nr:MULTISPECIES: helix-turn-helix domain-containing protein [unclassified Streptomyces]SCD84740.1 NB-ARC domain-containing protein [Streptomyces sp. DvalAA-43]